MEVALSDTIIVRRLPEVLTDADLNDLFSSFGALHAFREKPAGKMKRSSVIVKFPSHEDASYAMHRLHQLLVVGVRLVVEYAGFSVLPKCETKKTKKNEWRYPTISETVVKNISAALYKNSEFYHKVIQLMNDMNLPPPFIEGNADPVSDIEECEMEELYKEDTEESELESDSFPADRVVAPVPVKRKSQKPLKKARKIVVLQSSEASAEAKLSKPAVELSQVFDKSELHVSKKFKVMVPTEMTSVEVDTNTAQEGFGTFAPPGSEAPKTEVPVVGDSTTEELDDMDFISSQTLRVNVISKEEMKLLAVFKNYSAGEPNSRLYIKNLSKTVNEENLKHIYGRYVVWTSDEERNMFDIRLMTEGRMKGQAFVTLPSVKRAEQALQETNGLVYQGKPLVVQFARSAQPTKQNVS